MVAFCRERLKDVHEFSSAVGQTVGQQGFKFSRHVATEPVGHLDRGSQLGCPVLKHIGEILTGLATLKKIAHLPLKDSTLVEPVFIEKAEVTTRGE